MTTPKPTIDPGAVAHPGPLIAMDPAAVLATVIDAARLASPVVHGPDGRQYAVIPRNHDLRELANPAILPPWPHQRVTVDDRASLVAYANRFSDPRSVLLADYDAGTISARLDWHSDNRGGEAGPGPDKHSVTLKLRASEEFARWDGFEGQMHNQDEFAHFLEENAADVAEPEAAVMIEISRDFEATVGQTYKSSVRLDNGDRRMVFESETKAMNGIVVPQKFRLSIPVYQGERPELLTCLFRWRAAGGGKVQLGFEWHRVEYLRQAHFAAIAFQVAEDTGLPVFIGRQGDPKPA